MLFGLIPFLLFSGCGDLEPEMQDTRSVVLKMDFNQRSSSRNSSVSQAEVSSHKTHLILALPSGENLSSNYKNYYSSFAQELMNPLDNKVSLEIPLNTQMKIFAFLFKQDYTMPQLKEVVREVGYYGQSQPFSIDANTNNLALGITLIGGGTDTGGGAYTIAPIIETVTAVTTTTSNSTPEYTFASTKAGSISYGGSCYSATIIANIGNNTIVFNALIDGYYDDCTIKVTDSDGNESNTLTIPPFTVDTTVQYTPAPTVTFSPANGAIGVDISGNITITFSEAVRNSINNTELTDSNIDSHITLKYNDASGSNIDFDATINTDKKVITINPTSNLPNSQDVYVAIGATLEDYADNLITAANATFTTMVLQSTVATQPPLQNTGSAYNATSNKYVVSTLGHLSYIAQNTNFWNYAFIQTADIDATVTKYWDDVDNNSDGDKYNDTDDTTDAGNNEGFSPIGNNTNKFEESYDGAGYTINGLTIARNFTNETYTGLFGFAQSATINNLGLTDVNITGQEMVGPLVGFASKTDISKCYATAGTVTGTRYVGGLVGYLWGPNPPWYSTITNSYSTVDNVTGSERYGGLVGFVKFSSIISSYSTGSMETTGNYSGGLVGGTDGSSGITITDSFYDSTTSTHTYPINGTGKTTAEMKTKATFTDTTTTGLSTSWDFDTIWNIDNTSTINGGYPYLR